MLKEKFYEETSRIARILDQSFGTNQRYDITSQVYKADLYDDFLFIKNNIDTQKPLRILDIGCGKGHLTALLSVFLNQHISAVDLDESFGEGGTYNVEHLGERWQEKVWHELQANYDVDYKFYDGKRLPYEDNSFDVLVAYAVIEHVESEDAFLQECNRVLKAGGTLFIFRCPNQLSLTENVAKCLKLPHHDRLYNKQRLEQILKNNQLSPQKIKRYDTVPAFMPFQQWWNKLFFLTNIFRNTLMLPIFVWFAHHYRVKAIK